jgi:hypothetical protein
LRQIDEEDEAELGALDPLAFPATRALIPAFKGLDCDAAFRASVDAFIHGVQSRCDAGATLGKKRKGAAVGAL